MTTSNTGQGPATSTPSRVAMVTKVARALCRDHATVCNVNVDDLWKLDSEDFIRTASLALDAAHVQQLVDASAEAAGCLSSCADILRMQGKEKTAALAQRFHDGLVSAIRETTGSAS